MENFDIEKLERKNIYRTPTSFFEKVQNNVLQETGLQKEEISRNPNRTIHLNWGYAVAASLILLFGLLFVFSPNTQQANQNLAQKDSVTSVVNEVFAANSPQKQTNVEQISNEIKEISDQETRRKENNTAINSKPIAKNEIQKISSSKTKNADQVDLILNSFSEEEISSYANNAEQDVYLDLYN